MPKISPVSGNWLQIIKLCVNLNSAILRCSAVIPITDIGEPSAVFNLAVVVLWVSCNNPQFSCGGNT